MPEGPEIQRAADRLRRAILDTPLLGVAFGVPALKVHEPVLAASRVTAIETRGKALLTHFACGLSVYSHNQLYGVWRVTKPGVLPQTTRSLRFAVHGQRRSILLYSASDIAVLDAAGIAAHPFLAKLGPDVLDPCLTVEAVRLRLADPRFARRRLTSLLLDQSFFAGIGNYLRSEIAFVAGLDPRRRPADLDNAEVERLAAAILAVCRQAYTHRGVTNALGRAALLQAAG
ncbi:MAG: endonuclease VIII [Xanthomonadales bacterium]|jgi:endonuclease-8|nr:endonuclease VIII [Xanthomonadales bacterium]